MFLIGGQGARGHCRAPAQVSSRGGKDAPRRQEVRLVLARSGGAIARAPAQDNPQHTYRATTPPTILGMLLQSQRLLAQLHPCTTSPPASPALTPWSVSFAVRVSSSARPTLRCCTSN